jgi:hypothetical protein
MRKAHERAIAFCDQSVRLGLLVNEPREGGVGDFLRQVLPIKRRYSTQSDSIGAGRRAAGL